MKNLIDPNLLAQFQGHPIPIKEIVEFLDTHDDISTANLCRIIGISPQSIYNYRGSLARKTEKKVELGQESVVPKPSSKSYNRYTAEDKFALFENFIKAGSDGQAEILRQFGIYQTDISRWRDQIKEVSLEALGKRKVRSDKTSDEQNEIKRLKIELQEQEKTTAKLTTLLILQKKTFNMLKSLDSA